MSEKKDYSKVEYIGNRGYLDGKALVLQKPTYRELHEWIANMPPEYLDDRIAVYVPELYQIYYMENVGINNDVDNYDDGYCTVMLSEEEAP